MPSSNSLFKLKAAKFLALITAFGLSFVIYGQQGKDFGAKAVSPATSGAGKRLALVIGNAAYQESPLNNPINDAKAMAQALSIAGFEIMSGFDLTKEGMENLISDFGEKLKMQKGVGLVYYSGHGVQMRGVNYLIPVDFTSSKVRNERLFNTYATNLEFVLEAITQAENTANILILDACRTNPFADGLKKSEGLAKVKAPSGTFISYATQPDSVASDGKKEAGNSPYTAALVDQIKVAGATLDDVFREVGIRVEKQTNKKQVPWVEGSFRERFYFVAQATTSGPAASNPLEEAKKLFQTATYQANNGNYDGAIINLNKALALQPQNYRALSARAWAFYNKGDFDQSLRDYNAAIALEPNFSLLYRNRAKVFDKKGDTVNAENDRQKAKALEAQ